MTVGEWIRAMEGRFPPETMAPWDNDGVACCPDEQKPLRRVLIALDLTEAVADAAVRGNYDAVLTHHPLLFHGVNALTAQAPVPRKLLKLARAGVTAVAYHSRLDAAAGGVNDVLASLLGLSDVRAFAPAGEIACGRVGTLARPTDAAAFAAFAREKLGAPAVVLSGEGTVRTVAVLGGEGGDFVEAAKAAGADLFLAGRIGYHRTLDAPEAGLVTVEAGHYYTERPVLAALEALTRDLLPEIEITVWDRAPLRVIGKD